jgi:diaminohydroxyphosphoribosylaminopyrimidine deaminase/5-amino-6-(5-phosphoribosylamino)uracil reductase
MSSAFDAELSLPPPDAVEEQALARALELAARGHGRVEPNPPVGAVLLAGGVAIGEGWHREYGALHAEAAALAAARASPRGATLVVTLEPCTATGGAKKQPPCVDALLAAGIARVVIGAIDPDPRHSRVGIARLSAAGLEVALARGDLARRCGEAIARFAAFTRRVRPWVVLKWAEGSDGAWSVPDGARRRLSAPASLELVHELRAGVDAIAVGAGTVLRDDPRLDARPPGPRPLLRVILDGRGRVPATARCLAEHPTAHSLQVVGPAAPPSSAAVERLVLDDPHDLTGALLPALWRRGIRRLLLEGGPTVAAGWIRSGVIDSWWRCAVPRPARGERVVLPPLPAAWRTRIFERGGDSWIQATCS